MLSFISSLVNLLILQIKRQPVNTVILVSLHLLELEKASINAKFLMIKKEKIFLF